MHRAELSGGCDARVAFSHPSSCGPVHRVDTYLLPLGETCATGGMLCDVNGRPDDAGEEDCIHRQTHVNLEEGEADC